MQLRTRKLKKTASYEVYNKKDSNNYGVQNQGQIGSLPVSFATNGLQYKSLHWTKCRSELNRDMVLGGTWNQKTAIPIFQVVLRVVENREWAGSLVAEFL